MSDQNTPEPEDIESTDDAEVVAHGSEEPEVAPWCGAN